MDRQIPTNTRRRRAFLRGVYIVLIAAGVLAALVWLMGLLEPTLTRARMRTATVDRGPVEAVITASGTVEPATEQVVSSPIDARVLRVLHRPGAVLEVGDTILELDTSQVRLDLAGLKEEIEQTTNRRHELNLDLSRSLIEFETRGEIAGLDVEQFTYQLEQSRELFAQGLISEAALRRAETAVRKARLEKTSVERSIENARETARSQLARLDSELRTLKRRREETLRRLELATTRAESAGVLTWVVDEEGATVGAGDTVARIADLGSFRVEATVSDIHAARLAEGLTVRLPLAEETLEGRVERVYPAVESGTARFWVSLAEPSHQRLRANLRVDVHVVTEAKRDVLRLRKGPFADGSGPREVFVVRGDVAERRTAVLGLSGYELYEVTDGLEEGELVVISATEDILHREEIEIR